MSDERPGSGGRTPQDLSAEKAVLGGILTDNQVFDEIGHLLTPADFHLPAHNAIYEAIEELQKDSSRIDQVTLTSKLRSAGTLNKAGGLAYLAELESSVPTSANTISYAKIVMQHALKRRLIEACRELTDIAQEPSARVEEVLDEAQRRVFAISERNAGDDLRPFHEVLDKTLELIDKLRESGITGVTGLPTGFAELDKMLTGLHPGELLILAARPGCGKTTLALNVAAHAAVREGQGVAVFSLEMPNDQLAMRMLSSESRIDMKKIRQGGLGAAHMEKIQHAASKLWNAPLYIDDSGALSSFDLRTKARRLAKKLEGQGKKLSLIVIDYLQLMHQRGKVESRQQEVQEISRGLKSLAKELKLPIIALSQLNRKVEERKGKGAKPMLSDLRESGAIEQDADVVMFIHRPEGDEDSPPPQPGAGIDVEVVIAKQRNGPTGEVPLLLFAEYTRFESKFQGPPVQ